MTRPLIHDPATLQHLNLYYLYNIYIYIYIYINYYNHACQATKIHGMEVWPSQDCPGPLAMC